MTEQKHILLVEDDDVDAFILNAMLQRNCIDCNIDRVVNGRQALKYIFEDHNEKPDLILLDLNMPVMGGKAFLEEVLKRNCMDELKVAILSSSGNSVDRVECLKLGASDYFEKPMNDELTKKVMSIINQPAVSG